MVFKRIGLNVWSEWGDKLLLLLQGPSLEWCSLVSLVALPFKLPPPQSTWNSRFRVKGRLRQKQTTLWVSLLRSFNLWDKQRFCWLSSKETPEVVLKVFVNCAGPPPTTGNSSRRLTYKAFEGLPHWHSVRTKRRIWPLLPSILWFLCVIRSLFCFVIYLFFFWSGFMIIFIFIPSHFP